VTDTAVRIECKWCHGQSPSDATTCDRCGAPLDVRDKVSDSGWRQAPRLKDATKIPFGSSSLEVDGSVVPVAEVTLNPGDTVFFEHHVMFWKHDSVPMSVMTAPGGARRLLGDLPFVLSVAHGPGRLAFSRDAAGALVVLPVDPGVTVDVRGHALLVATGTMTYSFSKVAGLRTMLMAGTGMYLDQFSATAQPGLLVLHGYGNVFERTLAAGESIQLEAGAFLYKDSAVTLEVVNVDIAPPADAGGASQAMGAAKQVAGRGFRGLKAARELMSGGVAGAAGQILGGGGTALAGVFSSSSRVSLMRLTGPGRIGMQSMYQHRKTD
jgi:uncharacterized protein (AIM24 family)